MTPEQASLQQGCRRVTNDQCQIRLSLDNLHCGACVARVERKLQSQPDIQHARVNLTTRSVVVRWLGNEPPSLLSLLTHLGYPARVARDSADDTGAASHRKTTLNSLLVALGVSGFAATNIMLLSVSVWSGADPATAHLFHVISAMIAVPAIAFSAQLFFLQAWKALRHARTNMDVPISIGILLATGASLYDTFIGDGPVYFEASLMLVFFLLIGRTLDYLGREKARRTVDDLARLQPDGAIVVDSEGQEHYRALTEVQKGDRIRVHAQERFPCDAVVEQGRSEVDMSLLTGESLPQLIGSGSHVQAGTLNLLESLTLQVTAGAEHSFLARTRQLMLNAELGRGRYRRVADRAAQLYAPVVHSAAALGFLGWYLATGDVHRAIGIAVAVLIITCPCALGLAVPMAQVMVTRRLFNAGILIKDGSALEQLAQVNTILFDKTGTLTSQIPALCDAHQIDSDALRVASSLAFTSTHPHALSILSEHRNRLASIEEPVSATPNQADVHDREELAGLGIRGIMDSSEWRLGKADWALSRVHGETADNAEACSADTAEGRDESPGTVLSCDGRWIARFDFQEAPERDAESATALLASDGYRIQMISGDRSTAVASMARRLGFEDYIADVLPEDKLSHLTALQRQGHHVLMVGDGINDAPAMVAANVSMAPGTAADVGRSAADVVYLRGSLHAVPEVLMLAGRTSRIIRQNFVIALLYNLLALPLALAGLVTPLLAAIAMSSSSLLVVLNALRLGGKASLIADLPASRRLHVAESHDPVPQS